MTLVVSVTGREAIWLLADRRLSYSKRRPEDDAQKLMLLETADGVAILGYAGLGATALGTQPAEWMSTVLRGQNLPLEQSLNVLASAIKRQLPQHLLQLPPAGAPVHDVVIPAFVGGEPRLYSIGIALTPDRYRYTRFVHPASGKPPGIGVAGSSAFRLMRDKTWIRDLLRLVKTNDRNNVSPEVVADQLATLNSEVAKDDEAVGPRCIVAWRLRKGGGGQLYYTGLNRDADSPGLPSILRGIDEKALLGAMMPHVSKQLEAMLAGEKAQDALKIGRDEMIAEVARLPDKPDERLH